MIAPAGDTRQIAICFCCFLCLFLPGYFTPSTRAKPLNSAQDQITSLLKGQCQAWNRADLSQFMTAYLNSPELSYTAGGKVVWGYEALKERYEKKYGKSPDSMGKVSFSDLKIQALGQKQDAALVLGNWHLELKSETLGGVFSLVLEKHGQNWKIVHDHTSLAEKQNPQTSPE